MGEGCGKGEGGRKGTPLQGAREVPLQLFLTN